MKLGMPVLYEFNSIAENISLAKKLELDFIELNLNFGYCRKEMEKKTIENILKDNQLEATLHFYDEADFGSYTEITKAYIKLFKKYIKLGKNYLKMINIHLNYGPVVTIAGIKNYIYDKEYELFIKRLVNNIVVINKLCHRYNIKLVIENVVNPPFLIKTYDILKEKSFYFNYDIGHDNNDCYKMKKIVDNLELKEMHIHDGNTKTCHLAIGEGNIDIKYYKELAIKNNSYVVIEVKSSEDLIKSIPKFKNL